MKFKFGYLILLMILIPQNVHLILSQSYEGRPCKKISNPKLKDQINQGLIPMLQLSDEKFNHQPFPKNAYSLYYTKNWSTSILENLNQKKEPTDKYDPESPEEVKYVEFVNSTCKYSPFYVMDNDPKTAWSEGVDGEGIGEIVLAYVDISKPIKIWAGFGKSEELFQKNNRPKDITIYYFEAEKELGVSQSGFFFESLRLRAKLQHTLEDKNSFQNLPQPKNLKLTPKSYMNPLSPKNLILTVVAIQINSVYKGTEYDDTLISEISN